MAHVLIPLPGCDFDPTEVAVSWRVLTDLGHRISFSTPDGKPAQADPIMLSGRGLDPWSPLPIIGHVKLIGLLLRANKSARRAYAAMTHDAAFRNPSRWEDARVEDFNAILLGGGHRKRGMQEFLESKILQTLIAEFFASEKPVAAICHGVLLVARSKDTSGRSVLYGRRTTALTWKLERAASAVAKFGRFWDPDYYRTYVEERGQPTGYMSVQHEVTRYLEKQEHFEDVAPDDPFYRAKTSGTTRDSNDDSRPAWVVIDGSYVSARWPGDAHTFARTFDQVLSRPQRALHDEPRR